MGEHASHDKLDSLQRTAFQLLRRTPVPIEAASSILEMIGSIDFIAYSVLCRLHGKSKLTAIADWNKGPETNNVEESLHLAQDELLQLAEGDPLLDEHVILPIFSSEKLWGALVVGPHSSELEEKLCPLQAIAEAYGWAVQLEEVRECLESESSKLASMINGMEEGVVFADADGQCVEVNPYFCDFIGTERERILSMNIVDVHRGPASENLADVIKKFSDDPHSAPVVVQRTLRGSHVLMRLQPIYRGSSYAGILLNLIPVGELVEARQAAEAASNAKSRFLAAVSHEIRTPLNTIIGFSDLLLNEAISQDQLEMATAISKAGRTLLEIINDILDLSRIEADKLTIDQVRFRPAALIDEVMKGFIPQAEIKNVKLLSTIDDSVPTLLLGDRMRVRQIISNLLSNAMKFTEEGHVAILVSGEGDGDAFNLRIRVKDTGIGIPSDRLQTIFEPFSQGDTSITNRYGGTGLGLAICRRLASLMEGSIDVLSTPGRGSTFTVHLKLRQGKAFPGVKNVDEPATVVPNQKTVSTALRVLVVEDNEVNQNLAVRALTSQGFTVETADDGRQALDKLHPGHHYDVVLMDVQMPVMDGIEAMKRLRQQETTKELAVVALSASSFRDDKVRCLEAGFTDYACKPVDWKMMAEMLASYAKGQSPVIDRPKDRRSESLAAENLPVFDRERALEKLCGDDDLLEQIIAVFVSNAEVHIGTLHQAIEEQNQIELVTTAHKLKGAAASVGATRIAALALSIEDLGRQSDYDGSASGLVTLIDELTVFKHAVSSS